MADDAKTRTAAPEPGDDLLTLAETIAFLGVSKQTLYRMMERGELKGIKVGRQWRFRKADLQAYLERGPQAALLGAVTPDDMDALLPALAEAAARLGITMPPAAAASTTEEVLTAYLNRLFHVGIAANASDIHLMPERREAAVRLRIDGVLHEMCRIPASAYPAVVAQLKQLVEMNVEERGLPQDGRLHTRIHERDFDMRVNVLPTVFGESVVMRILAQSEFLLGLDRVGLDDTDRARLQRWIRAPHGLVLFTGPCGSGKTTVMYSCLLDIQYAGINIMTIEDPVEVAFPNTRQVQVNRRTGLTFPVALRAFLRHDPDVIMAGEIRDLETATLIVQAALTGHLVLSTLHTNDASSAASRLVEMGVEPFLVASSLLGVVSQRLVRRLCPQCKQPAEIPPSVQAHIHAIAEEGGYAIPEGAAFFRAVGCEQCHQRGFRGRTGLYELLEFTPEVKEAFLGGTTRKELAAVAVRSGMHTLRADGIRKAVDGITTVDEVLRVVPE